VSCCPPAPVLDEHSSEGTGMRIIGLDIHRAFAEAVAWQEGKLKRIGRIDMRRDQLTSFAASLLSTDVVVVEATGNAAAVAR
jgi:transposase